MKLLEANGPVLSRSALFAERPEVAKTISGVTVINRDSLSLATMRARKSGSAELERLIRQFFKIELPLGPRRASSGDFSFIGMSPGTWLVTHENYIATFAASVTEVIGSLASISDQSDGYAVLRLSGTKVRDTLRKLISIDLHPSVFKPGNVAATMTAHMPVTLWRLQDEREGTAVFEVAVSRSCAESFWHVLSESAAEFGLRKNEV